MALSQVTLHGASSALTVFGGHGGGEKRCAQTDDARALPERSKGFAAFGGLMDVAGKGDRSETGLTGFGRPAFGAENRAAEFHGLPAGAEGGQSVLHERQPHPGGGRLGVLLEGPGTGDGPDRRNLHDEVHLHRAIGKGHGAHGSGGL